MAEELRKLAGVRTIQLIDVPIPNEEPHYRLLVVVDDALAAQYQQRLLNPTNPHEDNNGSQ